MIRWVAIAAVIAGLLGNGLWLVQCKPVQAESSAASDETPDCCLHGLCPLHAAEHHRAMAMARQKSEKDDDCPCGMASKDFANLVALAPLVVVNAARTAEIAPLGVVGLADNATLARPVPVDLSLSTPPPRS